MKTKKIKIGVALFSIALLSLISVAFSAFIACAMIVAVCATVIIWKNPFNGILAMAALLPFERIGAVDVGGVTLRPSQMIALLTIVIVVIHYLSKKKSILPPNPLVLPLSLFFIIGLLGLWNAPFVERSVTVLLFQAATCCVALLIPTVLTEKKQLLPLIGWLFLGTAVATLFGLFQFIGDWFGLPTTITGLRPLYTKEILGFPRIQSTALEPLYFANYLLLPLSLCVAFFLDHKAHIKRWMIIVGAALVSINFLLTVARGAYIAAIVMFAVLLFFFVRRLADKRIVITVGAVVLICGAALSQLTQLSSVPQEIISHAKNLFGGASYVERVDMFAVAYDAWQRHPFVGIGSGSFGPYQATYTYTPPLEGWKIVNNEYLELLAENGVLGLIAMLIVFLIVIVRSLKAIRKTDDELLKTVLVGAFAAFVGVLIQYNTFSILYILHVWFLIGLLVALQNMVLHKKKIHDA